MDWEKLLKLERLNEPNYVQRKHRPAYAQDIDRILFSPPFRRLANKTQVHPLYDNDHVHHRLIHSLEVASVGHTLGVEVGSWLADERQEIESDQVATIAGLVQTACMAHDIGNPPFGHSGEEAMASWFRERFLTPSGVLDEVSIDQRCEFKAFEGNAQGFRILTRTEMYRDDGGMRLTLGSLGAFTKYPICAAMKDRLGADGLVGGTRYIGVKKYGFFENDVSTFEQVATELGIPKSSMTDAHGAMIGSWWRRHPLAFLMEAADDICYNIMDLEDAFLSGEVSFELVTNLLEKLFSKSNKAYPPQAQKNIVSRHRAQAIGGAISACVEAFKDNYSAIMAGTFPVALIDASRLAQEFAAIKETARSRIFNAARKTELEVFGRNVIYRVLDGLVPLLNELQAAGWDAGKLSSYHLQVIQALRFPIDMVANAYDALHALTDFVSGMTDRYAVKVADMVGGR